MEKNSLGGEAGEVQRKQTEAEARDLFVAMAVNAERAAVLVERDREEFVTAPLGGGAALFGQCRIEVGRPAVPRRMCEWPRQRLRHHRQAT